ncbi:App1 family protein [Variovorax sp. J22R24]|uniref:phosphatidate phosphatase App1 family protein n=1 Tax=Variovorax gracilis TaxID=3053502 RepID=UPI002578CCBC|nr:App1 family protein [Variovorax sp. J22R24]MDM0108197.1 App1 family protein [Variovorax sp. J22R24]
MKDLRSHALGVLCMGVLVSTLQAAPLDADEEVMFVPGIARTTDSGAIEVDVHAWLHEKEPLLVAHRVLARYLDLDLKQLSPVERARFNRRAALFRTESEEDNVIELVIEGVNGRVALPPTARSGRSDDRLLLDAGVARGPEQVVRFRAYTALTDPRRFRGEARLVPAQGLSVISDIDDTIKHTDVRNQREMLLNTFVRRFTPVEGMASHYRALAAGPDTRFHYLSSSPIQLYPPLADFLASSGFPAGSVHLRESTTWRTLIPSEGESRTHKLAVIERLLADFPQRGFLLVGDSGEADPEIYGEIARAHPGQIRGIVIRDATREPRESTRYAKAFEGVDERLWHVIHERDAWPVSLSASMPASAPAR